MAVKMKERLMSKVQLLVLKTLNWVHNMSVILFLSILSFSGFQSKIWRWQNGQVAQHL